MCVRGGRDVYATPGWWQRPIRRPRSTSPRVFFVWRYQSAGQAGARDDGGNVKKKEPTTTRRCNRRGVVRSKGDGERLLKCSRLTSGDCGLFSCRRQRRRRSRHDPALGYDIITITRQFIPSNYSLQRDNNMAWQTWVLLRQRFYYTVTACNAHAAEPTVIHGVAKVFVLTRSARDTCPTGTRCAENEKRKKLLPPDGMNARINVLLT